MSFEGKVVIVTGSSSGIGASTAIKFAMEGAYVVLAGRNVEKLKYVSEQCDKYGKKALVVGLDISDDEKAKILISKIFNHFGKLDILVNNAEKGGDVDPLTKGGNVDVLSEEFMENYDRIMKVNLRAVVYVTHLAIPFLIKSKGNIINVSSIGASVDVGVHGGIPYCTFKAGLNQFTRCVATQLAPYGVRVNTVSSGPVKTDIPINSLGEKYSWDIIAASTPLNRVSEPEEIADIVLYLASDKAKGITGSDFIIDNGKMLKS